jgi:hypothetical protein
VTTLTPILTPHGHLLVEPVEDAPALPLDLSHRLQETFARGAGHGLLQLVGAAEVGTPLPPAFGYWRDLASRYVSAVCGQGNRDEGRAPAPVPPPPAELERLAAAAPPMAGAEYLTARVLEALWSELATAFQRELAESILKTLIWYQTAFQAFCRNTTIALPRASREPRLHGFVVAMRERGLSPVSCNT